MDGADDSDDGMVEVWSTYSEDEEVRKPSHGKYFVAKESKGDKEEKVAKEGSV